MIIFLMKPLYTMHILRKKLCSLMFMHVHSSSDDHVTTQGWGHLWQSLTALFLWNIC